MNDAFYVQTVKSDLRFEVDKQFRENNILIPFPKREVYMNESRTVKNSDKGISKNTEE